LQLGEEDIGKDRLYRALDYLLEHKGALEAHLARRCGELFSAENEVLLYDVTSTYFEGQAEGNPQARPGVLGRVWIADRGMASADNLAWLRDTGRRYIIGAPKSELKKFAAELASMDGWRTVQEGVEVKLTTHAQTGETVILCRSQDRRSKEQAMHAKFSGRIETALQRLTARTARSKKRLDQAAIQRRSAVYCSATSALLGRFAISLEPDDCTAGFRLVIAYNPAFDQWAAVSEGSYLLRANIADWNEQQLWKAYIQLTQAEAAFRIQKDELSVRPIWHQREDRVQAHILVCFLAFVLWKTMEMWQQRAGLGNSPRTILEELARIQSHDVVLPTPTHGRGMPRSLSQGIGFVAVPEQRARARRPGPSAMRRVSH
jgi:transposase